MLFCVSFLAEDFKAFTARSVAGLIEGAGLLTKDGLPSLAEVFKDVENAQNTNYIPKNPDIPFRRKPSASDPKYKEGLRKVRLGSPRGPA